MLLEGGRVSEGEQFVEGRSGRVIALEGGVGEETNKETMVSQSHVLPQ